MPDNHYGTFKLPLDAKKLASMLSDTVTTNKLTTDESSQLFYDFLISIIRAVRIFHRQKDLLMYPNQSGNFQTARLRDFNATLSKGQFTVTILKPSDYCSPIVPIYSPPSHPIFATSDDTRALGFLFLKLMNMKKFVKKCNLSDDCKLGIIDLATRMSWHDNLDSATKQMSLRKVITCLQQQKELQNNQHRHELLDQLQRAVGIASNPQPGTILAILQQKLDDPTYEASQTETDTAVIQQGHKMSDEYMALRKVKEDYETLANDIFTSRQSTGPDAISCYEHINKCRSIYMNALTNPELGKRSSLFSKIGSVLKWLWASLKHHSNPEYVVPVFDNAKDVVVRASQIMTLTTKARRKDPKANQLVTRCYPTMRYFS